MKVYISARAKTQMENVKAIEKEILSLGCELVSDWTSSRVKRPYRKPGNRKHNTAVQAAMLRQAAKADVFILIDEPGLRGAYVELGVFLYDCLQNPENRKVFIVGPNSHEREFIFESPEHVYFVDTIEEVYKAIDQKRATA